MYSHHSRQYLTRSVLQPRVVYLPFESLKNYRWKYARREHLHNIFTSFVYKNSTDSFKFFITRNIVHSQLLDRYWRIKIYVELILTENSNFSFAIFLSLSFNFSHPKLESNLFSTQNDISPPLLHNYADIQIEKEVDRVVAGVYRNIA